ncbi:MAG: OmpA family protein [Luteimonas sp.]
MSVLPVSTVSIGSFPYLSLPEGYRTSEDSTVERDRAPFWTGKDFEWVEGRVHQAAIFAEPGTTFSDFELRSYVDAMLDRIGAVLVAEQDGIPMHQAAEAGLDEAVRMKYRAGLGHFYTSPVRTYVVRRADGNVWVHFSTHERGANWIIARSAHYDPTIRLLSGVELKRLIDADGRAIIHVNFGSGDAVVQSDSLPQLEQLVLLLNRNPDLSLSINGHTDSQGDAARNLALSTARAEAVTDALRQHGIEASRLVAEGFGEAEPLADNATAEGRARNRRVELVRR